MYALRIKDAMLIEMTRAEYRKRVAEHDDVYEISAAEAHRRVKDGDIHETGLWVDEGRIRYAKPDPNG